MMFLEEIQVFEQATGRVQMVLVGLLMKVNEKTFHVEHPVADPDESVCGRGKVLMNYPKLAGWGVRTRVAGSKVSFVQRYPAWDRRVGADRPRAFAPHQTSPTMIDRGGEFSNNGRNWNKGW